MNANRPRRAYTRRQHLQDHAAPIVAETTPRVVETPPEPHVERAEARAPMRPESPAARDPRARAAELRERGLGKSNGADKFEAPQAPDGWEYEWKRHTVLNQEDPGYQVSLAQEGWDIVPASRHPEFMPSDYTGEIISREGMILRERPKEINAEARARAYRDATGQVSAMQDKITGARTDGFEHTNKGDPLNRVAKGYTPVEIPAD